MPLYEYECDSCGHRFEQIRKFSDPPVERCPKCGSRVHKLISSPAFQFKGTGWYVTDYAKKDSGGDAKGEKNERNEKSEKSGESGAKADGKNDGKSDGKSESKSESKSETKSESKSDTKSESAKSS
jgi:putative FmdB family regulatory protein